ncbi:hypothetical protein GDZ25_03240 [Lactobacillus delbrueckii]|uniref:Uncharacterized protein n=1 Tax=Lactobacillus delbrueckii subsp. bulgaricus TaxID=1585 RepID=A0AAV5PG77_LACDE|nr:hypothetical protein [Lactobacillus delbrueckii]MPW12463.1 hypothetical protein [Lactobacillus delbrueckii]GMB87218.1 hypothetical protein ME0900_15920 [Lactobacillus delbrueckii subsp. bulgaricus]
MFKQLRKANQNDYLLITATLILLVVFSLSLLSYVQRQQKAAERDQAQALATGFSRTLKGEIKSALTLSTTLKGTSFSQRWQSRQFLHSCQGPFSRKYRGQQPAAGA